MAVAKIYNSQTGEWEAAITGATGPTGAAGSDGALSPNYIINGGMDIWQRGDSIPITTVNYTADRYRARYNSALPSDAEVTKIAFTPGELEAASFGGAESYLRLSVTTHGSATFVGIENILEDVRTLSGQTVTFSFWAKAESARSVQAFAQQEFGSGGSSATIPEIETFSLTTSWQRFTHTFVMTSVSGKTIGTGSRIRLAIRNTDSPDNSDLDIWGVQLEAGSIATPFKRNANSIAGEKLACKRYYQRTIARPITNLTYFTGGQAYGVFRFTEMRRVPDFDRSSDTGFSILSSNSTRTTASVSASFIELDSLQILATSTSATQGDGAWLRANSSSEYIELDAEL